MSAVKIEDSNFEALVLNSTRPVLVDFHAPWCGPCRVIGPVIDQLAEEYKGRVTVGKVNIDENPEVTHRWSVRSIPTIMMFANGKMVEVVNGLVGKDYLTDMIEKGLLS
jgi:thioredoxin 1